jgi:hypothetical protein
VVGHIGKPVEGDAVAWDAGTAVFAAGMEPEHPETVALEAGGENAVDLENMAMAQHWPVGIVVAHCSRRDVLAEVDVQVPDVPQLERANGLAE